MIQYFSFDLHLSCLWYARSFAQNKNIKNLLVRTSMIFYLYLHYTTLPCRSRVSEFYNRSCSSKAALSKPPTYFQKHTCMRKSLVLKYLGILLLAGSCNRNAKPKIAFVAGAATDFWTIA